MTATIDFDVSLPEQCAQIWAATRENAAAEKRLRQVPPVVRLWDGDMNLQHLVTAEYAASFEVVDGDTGPIEIRHPFDHPVGRWLYDMYGRLQRGEKRNVIITCDYTGARIGGLLAECTLELDGNGDQVIIASFASDYEQLKWYTVWSNPFLPAAVQFPRVFILPGPVTWVAATTLHLQLLRENLSLWALPDDPMNPATWGSLDQSNWPIVVTPLSFGQAMASGVVWGIASSRWKNYHDAMKAMLRDAEVTVVVRRYLDGDPAPWPGANIKHGALVVSFEDKSGSFTGTAHGGTGFDGLARTVEEFTADFIDTTTALVTDAAIPAEYYQPGSRLTKKELPFAVWLDGEETGLNSYRHKQTYGKGVQVLTGGHSMPGVNEAISAGIQALGDILGNLAQIGSIGGSVDTILKPFYEDTLLAWISIKSLARAQNSGWVRYFEYFQDGSGKAYTLSSLMALRAGFFATRTFDAFEFDAGDGAPFLIGDQGRGHLWLGDRGGVGNIRGDKTGRIYIERLSKLTLSWDRQTPVNWTPVFGDSRALQDPVAQANERLESIKAAVQELGVS
ncbi:hypothetical protein [Rhodococcus jostii]|uniref:Gp37-like protein n=1 Tax=Rhodococcus jostii TaxID=132919 RepID=UPI00363B29B1